MPSERIRWLLQALMDERIATFLRFAAMGFNTLQWRIEGRGSWKTGSYAVATICHVMGSGDSAYAAKRVLLQR